MAKLSDRQRKQIIAEYVEGDGRVPQRSLAKKYNVCLTTISKILKNKEVKQKCEDKKNENTRSMLEFLDEQKDTAQALMEKISLPDTYIHYTAEQNFCKQKTQNSAASR